MRFMDNLSTLILVAMIGFFLLYNLGMLILAHWFISAIIVGAATFIFAGQRLAAPAAILSAIIFLVLNFIFIDDSKQQESQIQEQRRDYQSEERHSREEQERLEREWQELERQQREERERQERIERQQREERERQERIEKASVNVYNKIFSDYYKSISEHRFSDAYSLLSEKEKQHQGSLENFVEGRKDVADIEILNFTVTDEKENTVVADYRIRTKDKNGNGFLVKTFNGNVTFVKNANTWKIDALVSKKVDERRE